MHDAVREQHEAFPDPSPVVEPIGAGQLDPMDDNLRDGWSWHRLQDCYRRGDGLKVLNAGCGTGPTTLALARLNPGSSVLGVDASTRARGLARRRASVAGIPAAEFAEYDLDRPPSGSWGPFDFVIGRRVLGQGDDPARILENLARVLDGLDGAYPRRPVRACGRHQYCMLKWVSPRDEGRTALDAAPGRLGRDRMQACADCPDCGPEE